MRKQNREDEESQTMIARDAPSDAIATMYQRRNIRTYLDTMVARDTIMILLKAAMAAPTAVNCQAWEFIVIDNGDKLSNMKKECIFARYNAPVAIIVCGNMAFTLRGPLWIQDCSAATENMLIAATSVGLGSLWIGIYPVQYRVRVIQKIFKIPEHVIPFGLVYLGYPAEEGSPRTSYDERRIYWQEYAPQRKHHSQDTFEKDVTGFRSP